MFQQDDETQATWNLDEVIEFAAAEDLWHGLFSFYWAQQSLSDGRYRWH